MHNTNTDVQQAQKSLRRQQLSTSTKSMTPVSMHSPKLVAMAVPGSSFRSSLQCRTVVLCWQHACTTGVPPRPHQSVEQKEPNTKHWAKHWVSLPLLP